MIAFPFGTVVNGTLERVFPATHARRNSEQGLTLLELVLACAILMILASTAMPLARSSIKRQREAELRADLREMRTAIDRYKDAADRNLIRVEVGSQGYPPDLKTLVDGTEVGAGGITGLGAPTSQLGQSGTKAGGKVRFLRRIPVDPMTGKAEWGLRAVEDDPDSRSWGGDNVFDIYSLSTDTALDGSNYADW